MEQHEVARGTIDMSAAVGRAGFRAVHAKVGGKFPSSKDGKASKMGGSNRAIVEEALRSLDAEVSAREAAKNANIVVEDESLNENWVNDHQGGMKPATTFSEALDYLKARNAQLYRRQASSDYEMSELVVHLPENMCVEDTRNVSYVLDEDGAPVISAKTGDPLSKPRLVPRDHVEARRYFDDAQAFLIEHGVIAGGIDGVHWRSDQYSEHRPHMQIGFDNYAADPKHPGHLRNEFSRKWFSHRDVVYPEGHPKAGRSISGKVKLSDYQSAMREYMIARGWPVQAEINQAQEGVHRGKAAHTSNDNARIIAEDRLAAAVEKEETTAARAVELDEFADELDEEAVELRAQRNTAAKEGYRDGKVQALSALEADRKKATAELQAAAEARADAEQYKASARAVADRMRALEGEITDALDAVGPAPAPPSYEEIRNDLRRHQPVVMREYMQSLKRKDGTTVLDSFELWAAREHAKRFKLDVFGDGDRPLLEVWKSQMQAVQSKVIRARNEQRLRDWDEAEAAETKEGPEQR